MLFISNLDSILKPLIQKIGKQEGGASFLDDIGQIPQSLSDICLIVSRSELNQLPDNPQYVSGSLFRGNKFFHLVAEEYYPYLVVVLNCAKSQNSSNLCDDFLLEGFLRPKLIGATYIYQ